MVIAVFAFTPQFEMQLQWRTGDEVFAVFSFTPQSSELIKIAHQRYGRCRFSHTPQFGMQLQYHTDDGVSAFFTHSPQIGKQQK
jgi:hypothetical protein